MRCEEYRKYFSAYMDAELDVKTSIDIINHLTLCEACTQRLEREQVIERLLSRGLKKEKMPEDVWGRVLGRVYAQSPTGKGRLRARWLLPTAVSLSLSLAIGLSIFFFIVRGPKGSDLIQALPAAHARFLREGVALKTKDSLSKELPQFPLFADLPEAMSLNGHDIRLVGCTAYLLEDAETACLLYRCCDTPVSVFCLRKEDLDKFSRSKKLIERSDGSLETTVRGMNLVIVDLGKVVLCGISSHGVKPLLTFIASAVPQKI